MNQFLRIIITENFQIVKINCQVSSLGTTHIGPVAQIVHNAYASISCSYRAWLLLLEDAQGNIFDTLREFDIRSRNLFDSYRMFNRSASRTSYNHQQIFKFYLSISNQISQLSANLIKFNQTLNSIDKLVDATIDRLTNETYLTCIDAIQDSVTKNKSCVPDIVQAQIEIFAATSDSISQCSHKLIGFDLFNGLTSLALRIPVEVFTDLISCTAKQFNNKTKPNVCIKSVSFTHFPIVLIKNYFVRTGYQSV